MRAVKSELTPEIRALLQSALNRTPSNTDTIESTITNGEIWAFYDEGSLIGATYLEFLPDLMNIILMAGNDIASWRDELVSFYIAQMKFMNVKNLCIVGRHGWGSLFKELTPIGMLYTFCLPN